MCAHVSVSAAVVWFEGACVCVYSSIHLSFKVSYQVMCILLFDTFNSKKNSREKENGWVVALWEAEALGRKGACLPE